MSVTIIVRVGRVGRRGRLQHHERGRVGAAGRRRGLARRRRPRRVVGGWGGTRVSYVKHFLYGFMLYRVLTLILGTEEVTEENI